MNLRRLFKYWARLLFAPDQLLRHKYASFKDLLRHDQESLELITELEDLLQAGPPVDWARVAFLVRALNRAAGALTDALAAMHPGAYDDLERRGAALADALGVLIDLPQGDWTPPYTLSLAEAAAQPGLAGGKAHALSRVLQATGLPGPRGFVVTTRAFQRFLHHNGLRPRLDELLAQVRLDDWEGLEELSRHMAGLLLAGEVPAEVEQEILQRLAEFGAQGLPGPWSLRSSAVSEDGEVSFAGQYASRLGVAREDFFQAYQEVLASKYAPRAVAYRLRCGLADQETPMAVLVMEMIDARVSGVVYTRNPGTRRGEHESLGVFAVPGLGQRLVDGSAEPEVHFFTRAPRPRLLGSWHGRTCPTELPEKACLSPETATLLATWAMRLEEIAGCPQDIEWSQDKHGECYLLQVRPLARGISDQGSGPEAVAAPHPDHSVLLEGGVTASPGVGAGPVWVVRSEAELGGVPEGAVLVSPTLSPTLAGIMGRLQAVVSESGSRASHFASVAREFGLPVLAAAHGALNKLPPGVVVTVDAGRGRVYQGEAPHLQEPAPRVLVPPESPFAVRLQKVMELVSPLHLLDPDSPEFTPANCRSLHDLVRFAHEKGMVEMFSLVGRGGRGLGRARQLVTDLPLTLYVLDLEGGLAPEAAKRKTIEPRHIASPLMRACWEGLTDPEVVWHQGLVYLDWEEVDRVSAGVISLKSALLASYAMVAHEYLHLVLRFGYHFAVLDALAGENPEANYIAFRFKGGGGNYENRLWRVELIKAVLEWAGFAVKTKGDLLEARFDRRPAPQILRRLTLLGILQGKTRLLDMALTSEEQAHQWVSDFRGRYGKYAADG